MLAWLEAIGIKSLLDWLFGKLTAFFTMLKRDQTDHAKEVAQAAQDTEKAKELKPDATEAETDSAIDDELKHL